MVNSRTPARSGQMEANAVPTPPRPFRPADLSRERQVTSFSLSADGSRCVFAVRSIHGNRYRSSLWRVATAGGRPDRLTTAEANDTAPRISPDGSTVVFVSDRGEGPATAAWVMPLDGGEPRRLAPVAGGVAAAEWSPDGRRVLLLGPTGEHRFSVGDPNDPTALAIDSLVWRVDGVGLRDQRNAVWIASADGSGTARRITPAGVDVAQPRWIDEDRIGFLADLRP